MRNSLLFVFGLFVAAGTAHAETIELVTYYPTSTNSGDLHVRSITVGTAYQNETPGNGVALIADQVGIGTNAPTGSLHVVGPADQTDNISFMPGTGNAASIRVGIGTTAPSAGLQVSQAVRAPATGPAEIARFGSADGTLFTPGNDRENRVILHGSGDNTNGRTSLVLSHFGTLGDVTAKLSLSGINTTDIPAANGGLNQALQLFTVSDRPLQIGTNNRARLTVTAAGNVGIGTTAPQATSPLNNVATGNADANDIFLRSVNRWLSSTVFQGVRIGNAQTYTLDRNTAGLGNASQTNNLSLAVYPRATRVVLKSERAALGPNAVAAVTYRFRQGGNTLFIMEFNVLGVLTDQSTSVTSTEVVEIPALADNIQVFLELQNTHDAQARATLTFYR